PPDAIVVAVGKVQVCSFYSQSAGVEGGKAVASQRVDDAVGGGDNPHAIVVAIGNQQIVVTVRRNPLNLDVGEARQSSVARTSVDTRSGEWSDLSVGGDLAYTVGFDEIKGAGLIDSDTGWRRQAGVDRDGRISPAAERRTCRLRCVHTGIIRDRSVGRNLADPIVSGVGNIDCSTVIYHHSLRIVELC